MQALLETHVRPHRFSPADFAAMQAAGIVPGDDHLLCEGQVMRRPPNGGLVAFRFAVADYYALVEAGVLTEQSHVELIDGQIIAMSPAKSTHAGIINRLARHFMRAFPAPVVSVQNPLPWPGNSLPEPDLALLQPRDDDYVARHPGPPDVLLLVEVSDTTLHYDRTRKLPLYAEAGIPEVWIVALTDDQIEVYCEPTAADYRASRCAETPTR